MIFRTPDIRKKLELERSGFKYCGAHNIYKNGAKGAEPTGKFEYEFDLPDEAAFAEAKKEDEIAVPQKEAQPEPEPIIDTKKEEIKKMIEQEEAEAKKPIKKKRGNPNWIKRGKKK